MTGERRRGVWKQAGALLSGHRWQVGLLGFLSFLGGVAEAVLLVLVARIAFALSEGADAVSIAGTEVSVGRLLLLAAALPFVRLGLSAVASWQTAILTTRSMAEVRMRLFRGFLETSWEVQSQERLGHLQEVLTTAAYQTLLALRALASALESVLSLVALVVAALVVDLRGSLAIGVAVVALMIVLHPLRASVQRRSRAAAGAGSDFATSLTEHSTLAREIRVFGVEDQAARDVERSIEDHRRALARTHFTEQAAPAGYRSVALLLVVIALSVVYLADVSDLASLAAVVLIMVRALAYGQTLQVAVQALHQGAPYLETTEARARIYEAAAVDRSGAPLAKVDEVAFDAVSFAYEADRPVLADISFRARRGELIGIVGPSGAGKTTLVQLLLRLREPTTGRVLADGRDARELSLDDWYDRVGFAPQEPGLLTGTVYDNIAFFRPTDLPAVERAAALAQIHDEIQGWPEGYDTLVGERGAELSGGQRQRICLARALLAQPDVLVFDEPTSSLDARSEALFRTVVEARSSDAVVLVVAHRITTLRTCDRIMVLRDGVLEAFDSPAVLESSSPFFHEILRLSGLEPGAPTPTD